MNKRYIIQPTDSKTETNPKDYEPIVVELRPETVDIYNKDGFLMMCVLLHAESLKSNDLTKDEKKLANFYG